MALPTLTVEFAPTNTALSTAPTWVDITAYVLSFDTNRGFGNELDTVADAGTASITLDNRDRRFDPTYAAGTYFGNLKPGKQIRIRATYSAVTYDIFRGHIEDYPQTYPGGMFNTEVTLPCVDGKQYLSRVTLENDAVLSSAGRVISGRKRHKRRFRRGPEGPASISEDLAEYSDLVMYSKPWAYWPVSGSLGDDTIPDVVGGKMMRQFGGCSVVAPTATGNELVWGDEYPPATAEANGFNGDYFRTTGVEVSQFKYLTVECVFELDALGINQKLVSGPMNSGNTALIFTLFIDSSNQLNAQVRLAGAGSSNTWTTGTVTTSTTYHAALIYDSAAGTIGGYLNGVGGSGSVGSTGTRLADPGSNNNIFLLSQPNASVQGPVNGRLMHAAIYNRALTATTMLAHYNAVTKGFRRTDSTSTRVGAILDAVGWPASWRDVNSGTYQTLVGRRYSNQSAMEEIQTTMDAEFGRLWLDPTGNVQLYLRDWRNHADFTSSAATFGDDPTENRYTDIGQFNPQDDSMVISRVTAKSAADEDVQINEDTSIDPPVALDLGEVILDSASSADSLASALVTRYKTPQPRFREITIEPEVDPTNLWPKVLGYDLCKHVTIKKRPKGSADTAISQASHVERISHSCTVSTGNWVTRWTVSPR